MTLLHYEPMTSILARAAFGGIVSGLKIDFVFNLLSRCLHHRRHHRLHDNDSDRLKCEMQLAPIAIIDSSFLVVRR